MSHDDSDGGRSRREWLQAAAGLGSLLAGAGRAHASPIGQAASAEPLGPTWPGNVTSAATRLHRPRTLDGVRRLVRDSDHVKARGGRHSFSTIADTRGTLLALE